MRGAALNGHYICYKQEAVVICDYNPPLRASYVTIQRYFGHDLEFCEVCEVEVMSCPPGSWGKDLANDTDCSQTCRHCAEFTCRVSDGYCYRSCARGYWGDRCDKRCYCREGLPCNRTDGSCPNGNFFLMSHLTGDRQNPHLLFQLNSL